MYIKNSVIEGYIVVCEKDSKPYLNLLCVNKSTNVKIDIHFKETEKEYTKRVYDINGSTTIYGLDLSEYLNFSIHTYKNNVLYTVYDYDMSDVLLKLLSNATVSNGVGEFPDSIVHENNPYNFVKLLLLPSFYR